MEGKAPGPPLRVAWFYDLDACRCATGVTRHALAQRRELAARPGEVQLSVVTGRFSASEAQACWGELEPGRRWSLPLRTRDHLRCWRLLPMPALEAWTGPLDWVYCPAEFYVPARKARRAVTSHDIRQDLDYGGPRRRVFLGRLFDSADCILSVSQYNSSQLLEAFPQCGGKVSVVPNAADEIFFEPASAEERASARPALGLPAGFPFLLSVANYQARKNLPRLIEAASRVPEVARGDLAIVLVGDSSTDQRSVVEAALTRWLPRAQVIRPGYVEGLALRALYAEAQALVFPSLCEGFGIPAVEAMAQGCPVLLADTTALPEIAGEAGWYFDPMDVEAIAGTIRQSLAQPGELERKVKLGYEVVDHFRWTTATDLLLEALRS